jgi:steroid delta-isomerase-like uncharacterized protein
MFARHISLRLKPGKLNEFNRTFDKEIFSMLRNQPGFREAIMFAQPGEIELTAISLWDTKEHADAYNASAYPRVLQSLQGVLDGTPQVQNLNVVSSTMHREEAASGETMSGSSAAAGRGTPSTMENNKEIARRFIEDCWNKGDQAAMRDVIADNCSYHDPAFPGIRNIPDHIASCRSAFPDLRFTIEDMIGERNEVVIHWTARGTHKGPFLGIPPTDRSCSVTGTSISRIEGGKLVESWADWNVMTLMEQLGVAAAPKTEEKVARASNAT